MGSGDTTETEVTSARTTTTLDYNNAKKWIPIPSGSFKSTRSERQQQVKTMDHDSLMGSMVGEAGGSFNHHHHSNRKQEATDRSDIGSNNRVETTTRDSFDVLSKSIPSSSRHHSMAKGTMRKNNFGIRNFHGESHNQLSKIDVVLQVMDSGWRVTEADRAPGSFTG